MNSLLLLIPLSILILVGAGIALFWAIDHGQFDDMETSALLPVIDADRTQTERPVREETVVAASRDETAIRLPDDGTVGDATANNEARLAPLHASERPR